MATRRRQHIGKSRVEREEYVNSVIGQAPQPTVDLLPPFDPTDAMAPEEERTSSAVATARKPSVFDGVSAYWRENTGALFMSIIILVAAGLFYYVFHVHTVASGLNREVGELKTTVEGQRNNTTTQWQRIESAIDKLAERVIRNEDRVNNLYDGFRNSKTPAQTKR